MVTSETTFLGNRIRRFETSELDEISIKTECFVNPFPIKLDSENGPNFPCRGRIKSKGWKLRQFDKMELQCVEVIAVFYDSIP